jgi:hypothetical protein
MKTQSFTFRIPIDLLEAIKSNMGDCTRSEFIIQTLREALGVESQQISASPQISDLLYQFEILKSQFATISDRVSKLEEPPSISTSEETESKTEGKTARESDRLYTVPSAEIESKTESKANSKTEKEGKLPLDIPDEIPLNAKIVNGGEMIRILQKEDPVGDWGVYKLRVKRQGKAATKWHTVGNCRFIYKGPGEGSGNNQTHEWWVIYPPETSSPATSSSSTAALQEFHS